MKVEKVETLTLRDYIDKKMTELHDKGLSAIGEDDVEAYGSICKLVVLQDIAERLEYGFITEIGKTDLKHHLQIL